ncbi:heme-copper oxidase subunit III [Echinicola jeungdonensis]|uniref:Heme-copper oxidase subunit III n=1 Tax=Echinicola jeungdonensis TaxID=709343 RepID=A0ABV5J1U8_9BACT
MKRKIKENWFQKLEKLHPYQTLVYLGMVGSGLIFLFLTLAYMYAIWGHNINQAFHIPFSFWISTGLILSSSLVVERMVKYYKKDKMKYLEVSLWVTFILGILFSFFQFLGWRALARMGLNFTGIPSGSYLYVLTGIHIFHLIGVLIYAIWLIVEVHKAVKDPVKDLILFTNPFIKMKFKLFVTYWHFMDAVWMVLFFVFWFTF